LLCNCLATWYLYLNISIDKVSKLNNTSPKHLLLIAERTTNKRHLTNDISNIQVDKPIIVREFIPNDKKPFFNLFRVNFISLFLILPFLGLLSLTKSNSVLTTILNFAIGLSALTAVVTRIVAFFSIEPLNGQIGNQIIFDKKGILLNKKFYGYNEIEDISIFLNHYYKERDAGITADPIYHNGVDNKFQFRISGLYIYANFQIKSKQNLLEFMEYLKSIDDSIRINVTYKDGYFKASEFDPKSYRRI
jgi:hypothetical protein